LEASKSFPPVLLEYVGWLAQMDGLLAPLMGMIHLPAMAALPLLAGLLTGIYGAIAAMSVLPFTVEQMTLMAVFLLIAHSLVQEGLVQCHSGCPAWMATTVRLSAAVLTVWVLGWILGPETARQTAAETATAASAPFWPAFGHWAGSMAWLCLKILLIITALMILMELLKHYRLIDKVVRLIEPFLGVLGVDRQVGMLWLTAAAFGISYGGAMIVQETRERRLPPEQLKKLHVSIGINHAMIEDPVLFLALGIHPFWLWIPRLTIAVAFTHAYRLWLWIKSNRVMSTAAMLVFALWLAAGVVPRSTHAAEPGLPFKPGERLTFTLKWTVIPAGEAILEVLPKERLGNASEAYHFVLTARSNSFVDAFYKVRDRIDAWSDNALQRSLLYRKKQREGRTRRDVTVSFDWEKMTARYTNKNKSRPPIELTAGTFDPLSVFYWSRTVAFTVGGRLQRPVTDGKKHIAGIARVVRKETVRVPAGTFDAFLLEPDLRHVGGVFEKSPDAKLQLWVSADHRRLPLKIKSKVVVGSFTGELTSMTGTVPPLPEKS
jgi:hypothetical protein